MNSLQTILVAGSGMAFVGYVFFAAFVLQQQHLSGVKNQLQHQVLIGAAIVSALWALLVALFGIYLSPVYLWASQYVDVVRYGAWYSSILAILVVGSPRVKRVDRGWAGLAVFSALIVVFGLLFQLFQPIVLDAGWSVSKPAMISALLMPVWLLFLLEQLMRNVVSDSRWNLKPFALGLSGGCIFDIYFYAQGLMYGRIDTSTFSVRGVVYALMLPLMGFAVIRSRDWVRRIKVSRKIVFHTTMLLFVGGALLVMAVMGYLVRSFGGDWGKAFQTVLFVLLVILLAMLVFSGAMRSRMRVWVGKHFFRYRYDYREEWLKFTRALSSQTTLESLAEQIVRELAGMVESPGGCLWVRSDAHSASYRQMVSWNMPEVDILVASDSSLCTFLRETGWVINFDEYQRHPEVYKDLDLPEWILNLKGAWLVTPLAIGHDLVGFMVLARSRSPIDVNWEVNDLLKTAGNQAAGHLAQLLAVEALLETRKFEAFNRMSAFVVHDLKNIVAQLSLMLNNAAKHRDNPEFQQDMLETVEHALGKMKKLMNQLQEGGVKQTMSQGVNLKILFERIRAEKGKLGRELDCQINRDIIVRGDDERMSRVFGHLVQNALDATESNDGRVEVIVVAKDDSASVEIRDSGCGMAADFIRDRLFKPFQTTKKTGMGIGAYESYQYFKDIGGEVSVQSEVNQGTTMKVMLPLFQTAGIH